jgi:preprotein translocase subunit SecB
MFIECPRQILPFARRVIADVTRDGGYPPLMLDNIDFATLYRQKLDQLRQQQPATEQQPN